MQLLLRHGEHLVSETGLHLPAIYEFPLDTVLSIHAQKFTLCYRTSRLRLAVVKAQDTEGLFFQPWLLWSFLPECYRC